MARLTSDVDAEFVFDAALGRVLLASIDATTIGPLILLFKTLDTEDSLIAISIGPDFVSRIGGQVLEALEPFDFRRLFTKNFQLAEHGVLFRTGPLVTGLGIKFGRSFAIGHKRSRLSIPGLAERRNQ